MLPGAASVHRIEDVFDRADVAMSSHSRTWHDERPNLVSLDARAEEAPQRDMVSVSTSTRSFSLRWKRSWNPS
jgi:hypothetical protein